MTQSTPQGAAAGYINASAFQDFAKECTYVLPTEQPDCVQLLTLANPGALGQITIGGVQTSGQMAIVVAVGKICYQYNCILNANPKTGLPATPAAFAASYQMAVSELGMGYPALPLTQIGSLWYVDIGKD